MSTKVLSADDVLKKIGATDFRSISKDQLVSFVSSIPDMDKETAIECIKQFPEFKEHAKEIVGQLYTLCDKAMDNNKNTLQESINSYKLILDSLSEQLDRDDISNDERTIIIDKMVDVADRIAELARENTDFIKGIIHRAMYIAAGALAIGGAMLGVKTIGKK